MLHDNYTTIHGAPHNNLCALINEKVNQVMPIVEGSRVVVVSGEYGVGRHGRVKWLKHAGPEKWQRGALVEMDGPRMVSRDRRERAT